MDRRTFMRALSLAGLAGSARVLAGTPVSGHAGKGTAAPRVQRVAVIGAGIVGASIAYYLARRGCEVLILDQNAPAAQASGNTFAWINAAYVKLPHSYHLLSTYSLNEYHRLAAQVRIPVRWGGSLEWYDTQAGSAELIDGVANLQRFGSPTWMIPARRARVLEPALRLPQDTPVAHCTQDGTVDAPAATRLLVQCAVDFGATLMAPAKVTALQPHRSGMRVVSNVETFEVDLAVAAAGVGTSELAAMVGLELKQRATPGVIVTTEPMKPLLGTVLYGPGAHLHQQDDGRIVIGEKAGAPTGPLHAQHLAQRPNVYPTPELAAQHAQRVLATARRLVPALGEPKVQRVGIGWRPRPVDGLPIIGRPVGLASMYLAVMHSGVTLAPIIGHLAALEILDGVRADLLTDFRFERTLNRA